MAISIPSIIMAFNKPTNTKDKVNNAEKQALKNTVSIVSVISGIGILGAMLAPLGPAGSVAGMAIGSVAGSYISNKINQDIKTV